MSSSNGTSNSIIAEYKGVNAISGIKSTTCYYGTSSNPTTTGTVSESKCIFTNLNSNTTYYFKQCITTNARNNVCSNKNQLLTAGGVYAYDYTGKEQTLTIPVNGTYKLEIWGAQGGGYNEDTAFGGYGGYSFGNINLKTGEKIYLNIGGQGSYSQLSGYNGGGQGYAGNCQGVNRYGYSGVGATHIATKTGLLSSLENYKDFIIIVSGVGAGAYYDSYTGAFGTGGTTYNTTSGYGKFGKGGEHIGGTCNEGSGGGSGYFGGGASQMSTGAGGSSYIGNSLLTDKEMYCYNCESSTAIDTKTTSTTCTSSTPTANCAKQGNGYAKITILSTSN